MKKENLNSIHLLKIIFCFCVDWFVQNKKIIDYVSGALVQISSSSFINVFNMYQFSRDLRIIASIRLYRYLSVMLEIIYSVGITEFLVLLILLRKSFNKKLTILSKILHSSFKNAIYQNAIKKWDFKEEYC